MLKISRDAAGPYQRILQDIDDTGLDALLLLLWLCEEFSAAPNALQLQLWIGRLDLSDLMWYIRDVAIHCVTHHRHRHHHQSVAQDERTFFHCESEQ